MFNFKRLLNGITLSFWFFASSAFAVNIDSKEIAQLLLGVKSLRVLIPEVEPGAPVLPFYSITAEKLDRVGKLLNDLEPKDYPIGSSEIREIYTILDSLQISRLLQGRRPAYGVLIQHFLRLNSRYDRHSEISHEGQSFEDFLRLQLFSDTPDFQRYILAHLVKPTEIQAEGAKTPRQLDYSDLTHIHGLAKQDCLVAYLVASVLKEFLKSGDPLQLVDAARLTLELKSQWVLGTPERVALDQLSPLLLTEQIFDPGEKSDREKLLRKMGLEIQSYITLDPTNLSAAAFRNLEMIAHYRKNELEANSYRKEMFFNELKFLWDQIRQISISRPERLDKIINGDLNLLHVSANNRYSDFERHLIFQNARLFARIALRGYQGRKNYFDQILNALPAASRAGVPEFKPDAISLAPRPEKSEMKEKPDPTEEKSAGPSSRLLSLNEISVDPTIRRTFAPAEIVEEIIARNTLSITELVESDILLSTYSSFGQSEDLLTHTLRQIETLLKSEPEPSSESYPLFIRQMIKRFSDGTEREISTGAQAKILAAAKKFPEQHRKSIEQLLTLFSKLKGAKNPSRLTALVASLESLLEAS